MSEVPQTPALDGLIAIFRLLTRPEQGALRRCQEIYLEAEAERGSEASIAIASLRRVADILGEPPGIDDYKRVRAELQAEGEELMPSSRITRLLGSWHQAKEAVDLAEVTTARRINERFRKRRVGRIKRYTEQALRDAVARCVDELGHVPQLAEYDWWRQRQRELAQARGKDLHLPGGQPFRTRWGSWEQSLPEYRRVPALLRLEAGAPKRSAQASGAAASSIRTIAQEQI